MIGVLSDIHGNLHALDAVLADMPQVSQVWSLGDMLTGPPFPCEVIDRLLNIDVPVYAVAGNHEEYLLNIRETRHSGMWESTMHGTFPWVVDKLRPHHWAFFENLPISQSISGRLGETLICHGTPKKARLGIFNREQASAIQQDINENWIVCGHTHNLRLFRFGEKNLVTSGSVGMPLDGVGGTASYALIDEVSSGVVFRHVSYDAQAAIKSMHDADFYTIAPSIARAIALQIQTGRNHLDGLIGFVREYATQYLGYEPSEIPAEIWEEAEHKWDGKEWIQGRLR